MSVLEDGTLVEVEQDYIGQTWQYGDYDEDWWSDDLVAAVEPGWAEADWWSTWDDGVWFRLRDETWALFDSGAAANCCPPNFATDFPLLPLNERAPPLKSIAGQTLTISGRKLVAFEQVWLNFYVCNVPYSVISVARLLQQGCKAVLSPFALTLFSEIPANAPTHFVKGCLTWSLMKVKTVWKTLFGDLLDPQTSELYTYGTWVQLPTVWMRLHRQPHSKLFVPSEKLEDGSDVSELSGSRVTVQLSEGEGIECAQDDWKLEGADRERDGLFAHGGATCFEKCDLYARSLTSAELDRALVESLKAAPWDPKNTQVETDHFVLPPVKPAEHLCEEAPDKEPVIEDLGEREVDETAEEIIEGYFQDIHLNRRFALLRTSLCQKIRWKRKIRVRNDLQTQRRYLPKHPQPCDLDSLRHRENNAKLQKCLQHRVKFSVNPWPRTSVPIRSGAGGDSYVAAGVRVISNARSQDRLLVRAYSFDAPSVMDRSDRSCLHACCLIADASQCSKTKLQWQSLKRSAQAGVQVRLSSGTSVREAYLGDGHGSVVGAAFAMPRRCCWRVAPRQNWSTSSKSNLGCVAAEFLSQPYCFHKHCRPDTKCLDAWRSGKDYYLWPLDTQQERFCGEHSCERYAVGSGSPDEVLRLLGSVQGSEVVTFCGSPLASDPEFGPEVVNPELAGINLNNWDLEVTGEGRNWGLTHFDNVAAAFLVVFQSVTLEGWSDIMAMVQDAQSTVVGFIYFLLLIVLGAFFLVNVILAIIWDVFLNVRERQLQEKEEEEAEAERAISEDLQLTALADPSRGVTSVERHGCKDFLRHLIVTRGIIDPEEVLREESSWKFVEWSRLIATNWLFNAGVMAMILINVLVLAMDRYPEHLVESSVGDVLNYIFNIVFLLECVILHLALGPLVYWQDNAMAFDGVIVILSVVDILNDLASGAESGGSAITALRAFRMLRIFKLAKKFPSMKILLSAGVKTLMSMGDFVALLFLILCVFALMAQSFFGGTFMFDPENGSLVPKEEYRSRCPMGPGDKPVCVPRAHFDTFLWSFITIFQILTGENWNTVMYDGMRATGWMALWFFLLVVIFGNFVILNLFLAILMSNFDEQRSKLHAAMASKRELLRALETDSEEEPPVSPEGPRRAWEATPGAEPGEEASGRPNALAVVPGPAIAPAPGRSPRASPRSSRARTARMTVSALTSRLDWQDHELACARRCGKRSCLLFSQESAVRKACLSLIKHPHFDQVIMVFIILSSILMAFENPLLDPSSIQVQVLEVLSTIFTCIFAFELVVKMIALGAVCNPEDPQQPRAYLRSFENALDFVIVIVSVLDAIQTWFLRGSNGGVIAVMKIFRVVRMLRPLRLISRNKNLKVVVKTILAAVPELRNLLVFSSIFFLIFGLLAVGNLKGSYHSCKDKELEDHDFQSLDMTPLCLQTAQGFNGSAGLPVLAQRPEEGCAASEPWQRPSRDTPICEVHCDGASHSYCQNSTQPWSYHVMRCSDCSTAFCDSADSANHAACLQSCTRHEYFCKEVASSQREVCLEQCAAACTCRSHCWGLIQDAALCTEQGGKWVNMNQNFDDLLVGTISLFEISTTEGWVDVMLAAVDSRGPYLQPRRDANEFIGSMLFVAFMLIGSFFVLNLCVGVIIDNYNKQKSASDAGYVLVTETQAAWMTQMKALYLRRSFFTQVNVDRLGPSRQHRFRIITSSAFENFIMACILMQLCILMMVWQPRERQGSWEVFLSTCGSVFTVIFHIECLLKLSALHCNYFREPWNVFDFFCVVMSDVVAIIEAALTLNSTVNLSALVSALRVFRVARLFRLVRFLKGLNKLLLAFALSVPKLLNVGLVMVLLLYLYAVLGVSLFAKVAYTGTGIYGPQTNFRSFFQAISLLIRSMTGEGFNEIMHDLSKSQWYYESILEIKCSELDLEGRTFANLDLNGDGMVDEPTECGSALAYIYFISYTIFVSFVILNLFIAVIFEGFEESRGSELKEVINKCLENWERYDPFNTMLVALPKALDFIDETVEELMNAHQPSKGQCIPESRWNSRSTIDMNASEAMWSMYNLQYVRTLGLDIRSDGRVRLVQAVRAILRRLLIAGGPYSTFLPLQERRQRVRELEVLEAMVRSETEEDPAVAEIVALEARQKKQIQEALGEGALPMPSLPGHLQLSQLRGALHPAVGRREGDVEFSMLEKVAAAKIQRRSKESFQRRRDRARADHVDSDARSFGHGPITRAAG
eukprot:s4004_g2.t1